MLEQTEQTTSDLLPPPPVRERVASTQTQQAQGEGNAKGGVSILSPEGIVVLIWAFFLDILGVVLNILPGGGVISALLGGITIGPWVWFRGGGNLSGKAKMKKFLKRGGTAAVLEMVSLGIVPGWTILVILTLKKT